VVLALEKRGLSGTLNLAELTVTVSTTARTKDPKILYNAWECIVYIAQVSIPVREALFFLDDEFDCIKIGYLEGGFALKYEMKQEVYNKKRDRLYEHLNEIQVLCKVTAVTADDYISVGGATLLRLKRFRKVVEKCIIGNDDPAKIVYALQNHQTGRMLTRLKISG
jgi:rRNA processing protein Krr1/Pno1